MVKKKIDSELQEEETKKGKKKILSRKKKKEKDEKEVKEEKIDKSIKEAKVDTDGVEVREVIVEKKVGFNYLEVILIMIITLVIGGFFGSILTTFTSEKTECVKESISTDQYKEFIDTYNDIKKNYYEEIDEDALLDAGIKGMLEFLGDEYSIYMDKEETDAFNEEVEGKYEGIGVEIIQYAGEDTVSINRVFDDTPAAKAGLEEGDIIKKVNGEDMTGKTSADIADIIKKSSQKEVTIVVLRGDEEKEFTLERDIVELESVTIKTFEKNDKKIGYIYLSVFAANTEKQFKEKLAELEKENIDSLIIDVRSNTGGYLDSVKGISSMFLDKGKIIYQLDTKGIVEQIRDTSKESRSYPIVVLIDSVSASASEILAGALSESYGATLVGTASYGKGTVQRAYTLESGATIKFTIQKWLTPEGNWVNETGLTPDVIVNLSDPYFENPTDENDDQLQKALEELSK